MAPIDRLAYSKLTMTFFSNLFNKAKSFIAIPVRLKTEQIEWHLAPHFPEFVLHKHT